MVGRGLLRFCCVDLILIFVLCIKLGLITC